jgi:hypothetical protein
VLGFQEVQSYSKAAFRLTHGTPGRQGSEYICTLQRPLHTEYWINIY